MGRPNAAGLVRFLCFVAAWDVVVAHRSACPSKGATSTGFPESCAYGGVEPARSGITAALRGGAPADAGHYPSGAQERPIPTEKGTRGLEVPRTGRGRLRVARGQRCEEGLAGGKYGSGIPEALSPGTSGRFDGRRKGEYHGRCEGSDFGSIAERSTYL